MMTTVRDTIARSDRSFGPCRAGCAGRSYRESSQVSACPRPQTKDEPGKVPMVSVFRLILVCAIALLLGGQAARAQLIRQPNTTLRLPPDLPSTSGHAAVDALGRLDFNAPLG